MLLRLPEKIVRTNLSIPFYADVLYSSILKHARLTHFLPKEAAEDVHRRDPLIGDVNHYDYLPCVYEQRSRECLSFSLRLSIHYTTKDKFNRLYLKSEVLHLGREITNLRDDKPGLQAFYDQRRCDVQTKMRHADRCLQWQIACAEALQATYCRRKEL